MTRQRVELLARVHRATELAVDDVTEQAQLGGCVHAGHADSLVLGTCRVGRVAGQPIGCGQDGGVGVDHRLHFRPRVRLLGRQEGHGAVHRTQILGRHALDGGIDVGAQSGSGVAAVVGLDQGQCGIGGSDGGIHHLLQFDGGVDVGAVVGGTSDRVTDRGQVVGSDAADAQQIELALRRRCAARGARGNRLDGIGQRLHLGQRVHGGGLLAIDHRAQQPLLSRGVDTHHTQLRVVGARGQRLGLGRSAAIGRSQQAPVDVDDRLHLGHGVGGIRAKLGEGAVDGPEVGRVHAGDSSIRVVLYRRRRSHAVVVADLLESDAGTLTDQKAWVVADRGKAQTRGVACRVDDGGARAQREGVGGHADAVGVLLAGLDRVREVQCRRARAPLVGGLDDGVAHLQGQLRTAGDGDDLVEDNPGVDLGARLQPTGGRQGDLVR